MKVMLVKDVYKLGRAGDVKKVADGYGRNFLLPQGLAVLATAGALKQVEKIRSQAEIRRTELNSELKDLATQIGAVILNFAAKAGETGKLYGSITTGKHQFTSATPDAALDQSDYRSGKTFDPADDHP